MKEFIAETTSPEARGRAVSAMGRVRALAVPGDLVWLGWGVRRLDEDTVEIDGGQQASEGPSAAVRAVIDIRNPGLRILPGRGEKLATEIDPWEFITERFRGSEDPVAQQMLKDLRHPTVQLCQGKLLVRPLYDPAPAFLVDRSGDAVLDLEVPEVSGFDDLCGGEAGLMVWDTRPRSTRMNDELRAELQGGKPKPPLYAWHRGSADLPWIPVRNAPRACCDEVAANPRFLSLVCQTGCGQVWDAKTGQWRVFDVPAETSPLVGTKLCETGVFAGGASGSAWFSYESGRWIACPELHFPTDVRDRRDWKYFMAASPTVCALELDGETLFVWAGVWTAARPSHEVSVEAAWIVDLSEER